MPTHFNARSGFHIHSPSLWETEVSINLWSCSHLNNIFDIMNFWCFGTSVAEVFWDVMWHLVFRSLSRDCSAFNFRVKQSENNSIRGDCSNVKMKWLQHWAVTRPMTQCYNSENLNIRCFLYCCCCLYHVLYTDILFSPYFIGRWHFWFVFKSFLQVTANIDTNSLFYHHLATTSHDGAYGYASTRAWAIWTASIGVSSPSAATAATAASTTEFNRKSE